MTRFSGSAEDTARRKRNRRRRNERWGSLRVMPSPCYNNRYCHMNDMEGVMLKQAGWRMLMGVLITVGLSVSHVWSIDAAETTRPLKAETPKGPRAIIKTKFGDIEIKFYPDVAPKHVENFIKLAKSGFYNGTIFHRVIPGFMIQGGDPNTKDTLKRDIYGQGGPGHAIKAEFSDIPHKRGIVSMARAADPDSAGSQFFIVV